MKSLLALVAAAAALLPAASATSQNQYRPPSDILPERGMEWRFLGCRPTDVGLADVCRAGMPDSFYANAVFSELNGRQPSYATCGGDTPYASWCGARNPGVSNPTCIKSCADGGAFVMVGNFYDTVACLGSDYRTCSWFSDSACTQLQPLSKPITTVAMDVACPVGGGSGGWCLEATKVVLQAQAPSSCTAPPPPPPPPVSSCAAPKGGPDYGGSGFVCIKAAGADSYTPVKVTMWNDAACMSLDSRNCVWADAACCAALAASADNTTPYMSAGPIHAAVWGSTGYEDPQGWAVQGLAAHGSSVVAPPASGTKGCIKRVESGCVGGRYNNPVLVAKEVCDSASSAKPVAYLGHEHLGEDGCGVYGYRVAASCLVTDSTCGEAAKDVAVSTVRGPAEYDSGACVFPGPNSQINVAEGCTKACNVSAEGKGFAAWECRGQEMFCTCASLA